MRPRLVLLVCLALVLTAAAFARGLSGELVYDDQFTIARNPSITSFAHVPAMFARPMWDFTGPQDTAAVGYWRPLANVVLAIGWALGGARPLAYHVLSLVLHLAATAVAFRLALRLAREPKVAFFAALLFGVHPVHVESVSWISAINDPLFGLFALLAIDAWVSWRERGSTGMPWVAAAWLFSGLLSKELAVAIVPIVLCFDLVQGHLARLSERVGIVARQYAPLAAALGCVYVARVGVFGDIGAGFDRITTTFGFDAMRLAALRVEILGGLLALAAWPLDARVFPALIPEMSWSVMMRPILGLAGAVGAGIIAVLARSKVALIAVLFTVASLVPMLVRVESLGLFPVSARYAYLAVFGVALLVAFAAFRLLPRAAAITLLALACVGCGLLTHARTAVWRDDVTLLSTAVAESPRSPYALGVLGDALLRRYERSKNVADLTGAHDAYQKSLELAAAGQHGDLTIFAVSGDFVRANVGLGWSYLYEAEIDQYHDFNTAETVFKMVTTRYPTSVDAWTGLGVVQSQSGKLAEAEASLRHALEVEPNHAEAHSNLARVLLKRGDFKGAERAIQAALDARLDHVDSLLLLGEAIEGQGEDARLAPVLERARTLDPLDPRPLVKLGILRAKAGDFDGATSLFDSALILRADDGDAWLQKGKVLAARGEKTSALQAFVRACTVLTDSFEAHYNAGAMLLAQGEVSPAIPYLARAYESRPSNATGELLRGTLARLPIQSADVYLDLAATDGDRKDPDGALAWIAKAQALRPDDGHAHFLKGGMLRMKGERESALAEFEKAALAMPDNLMPLQACATLRIELGDKKGALDYLERALRVARRAEGKSAEMRDAIEALTSKIAELKNGPK